jgi:hypothetical protein
VRRTTLMREWLLFLTKYPVLLLPGGPGAGPRWATAVTRLR